jgi:hypothetical protein
MGLKLVAGKLQIMFWEKTLLVETQVPTQRNIILSVHNEETLPSCHPSLSHELSIDSFSIHSLKRSLVWKVQGNSAI